MPAGATALIGEIATFGLLSWRAPRRKESAVLTLDRSTVRLNAAPRDKAEAIRQVGGLLVAAGYITPDYIPAMMEREREATPLPNVLILRDDHDAIGRDGVA